MHGPPAIDRHGPRAPGTEHDRLRARAPAAFVLALLLALGACGERPDSNSTVSPASSEHTPPSGSAIAPDYPLQLLMKGTVARAMTSGSADALEAAFARIEKVDPPGYPAWKSIASTGAAAAGAGDIDGCRAACKSCHDQHRQAYREKDRGRALR